MDPVQCTHMFRSPSDVCARVFPELGGPGAGACRLDHPRVRRLVLPGLRQRHPILQWPVRLLTGMKHLNHRVNVNLTIKNTLLSDKNTLT